MRLPVRDVITELVTTAVGSLQAALDQSESPSKRSESNKIMEVFGPSSTTDDTQTDSTAAAQSSPQRVMLHPLRCYCNRKMVITEPHRLISH
ncbi:hypothetical protein EVAR_22929_1 [Eumeta japonica]|uniref:Uncharacterized protein n=1 Tax=Eumeta variegata TaxID=151549 RepID=A0A4C1UVI8_EUMVA|nr:hypothetical protein EVAR_22929_1 [Eumeta japonica]